MTATHVALIATHLLYLLAAARLVYEAYRLRRSLRPFLDHVRRRSEREP